MQKKYGPNLFPCEICWEKVPFKALKNCQRCRKFLCWFCVKFIEPYMPPGTYCRSRPLKLRPFDHPACPQCHDGIEKNNEEKEAEYERRQEEIYGTEEERRRREEEMYGDYEEEDY
jgi:hypothetical protein